jgi:hypothetical protein
MEQIPDDVVNSISADLVSVDNACEDVELHEVILTSKVMLYAYAASLVVLALGLVALVLGTAAACFFYPDKANGFVVVVGAPLLSLIIAHFNKAKATRRRRVSKNDKS